MKITKQYLENVIKEELETEMKGYEMAGEAQDLEEASSMSPASKLLAAAGLSFMALVGHRIATAPSSDVAMQQKILSQYSEYDEQTMLNAIEKAKDKAAELNKDWMGMEKSERAKLIDNALQDMKSADANARIEKMYKDMSKRTMNTRKSTIHK